MHSIIVLILLSMIICLGCVVIATQRNFVAVIALMLVSLLSALVYLFMEAPDVALTEAAVGACISSCILLLALRRLGLLERGAAGSLSILPSSQISGPQLPAAPTWQEIVLCLATCLALFLMMTHHASSLHAYGTQPAIQDSISAFYKSNLCGQLDIKSLVTGILADYRGFDTFCETLVIFTGGLCVAFILYDSWADKASKLTR